MANSPGGVFRSTITDDQHIAAVQIAEAGKLLRAAERAAEQGDMRELYDLTEDIFSRMDETEKRLGRVEKQIPIVERSNRQMLGWASGVKKSIHRLNAQYG